MFSYIICNVADSFAGLLISDMKVSLQFVPLCHKENYQNFLIGSIIDPFISLVGTICSGPRVTFCFLLV